MHITEIRRLAAAGHAGFPTGRNWYSWCLAFVRWVFEFIHGHDPMRYQTAREAWDASPAAASMDPYAAPPGALHWFTAGHPHYDVKISLGRGRVAHAYRDHDFPWPGVINIGEDEWESAAGRAPWMNTTYLGWTHGLGPDGIYTLPIEVDDPIPAGAVRLFNGPGTANARELPTTDSAIDVEASVAANDYGHFKARTKAQTVAGIDEWVQGYYSGRWFWLGSFTNPADALTLPLVPDPRPTAPAPAPEPYTFEAFHPVVSDVIPTLVPLKAERGNFPARPAKVVIHDFGEVGVHTYGSVINDFTADNGREVSSHFVIGWDKDRSRIVQMVSLEDRAYHAGPGGNDFIGIEVDPLVNTDTPQGTRLRLDVASLLAALREHYGYDMIRIEHNQVPGAATRCGDDIDLSWWAPVVEPPPIKPARPASARLPWWLIVALAAIGGVVAWISSLVGVE